MSSLLHLKGDSTSFALLLQSHPQQQQLKETNVQDLIQQEYGLLLHHLETIEKAMEIKYSLQMLNQRNFPELASYFPQTIQDIEIQQFNLNLLLPKRLTSSSVATSLFPTASSPNKNISDNADVSEAAPHEKIALWILEKRDLINSDSLSQFLQQGANQLILYSIASKICSLEIGQHFIDGLKYYLPVCGFWSLTFPSHPQFKEDFINYILEIYVKAHLSNSINPLLSNTMDHFNALIEIGKATIELCQSLQEQNKPQATMMSEYYQKVKIALRKTDGLTLSVKNINSLFLSASSSLITDIHSAASHPQATMSGNLSNSRDFSNNQSSTAMKPPVNSFLFTTVRKMGGFAIGFTVNDSFQEEYEGYLCWNALYLFELPVVTPNVISTNNMMMSAAAVVQRKKLFAVIPLKNIRIEKSIQRDDVPLLEFFDITGEKMPWILYNECVLPSSQENVGMNVNSSNTSNSSIFDVPKNVEYFQQLILKVSSSSSNVPTGQSSYSHQNAIEDWLDAFEECCWVTQMTNQNN
jgi:hypothetical protein